jgi:hypothetical protein
MSWRNRDAAAWDFVSISATLWLRGKERAPEV